MVTLIWSPVFILAPAFADLLLRDTSPSSIKFFILDRVKSGSFCERKISRRIFASKEATVKVWVIKRQAIGDRL